MHVSTLQQAIRDVPDFPSPGIIFKDITPILSDIELFRMALDLFEQHLSTAQITKVAGIEARGFLFAAPLAERLGAGIVPVRKQGKLPGETYEQSYDLEYGSSTLAIHCDAFEPGDRVVLIDDLLATGGTARAAMELIRLGGGEVVSISVLVELGFLDGRAHLPDVDIFAPIVY